MDISDIGIYTNTDTRYWYIGISMRKNIGISLNIWKNIGIDIGSEWSRYQ